MCCFTDVAKEALDRCVSIELPKEGDSHEGKVEFSYFYIQPRDERGQHDDSSYEDPKGNR